MNPTNQPVSFYGDNSRNTDGALLAALASKDYYAPALDGVSANGIGCARSEIGDLKGLVKDVGANVREAVKDAESQIRSDVRQEGQEAVSATKDAECRIVNKLGDVECKIIKENSDQTLYLTNQLSVIREQGIRNEYETKLSREQTIKEVNAKIDYKYDRLNDQIHHVEDKLRDCCCEQELAAVTQNGLLNNIISILSGGVLSAK